jgi:holliday junction DNA helicase RuvA
MYAYIRGRIVRRQMDALVVEAGGIGYRVLAAPGLLERFGRDGEETTVFTHLHVREDQFALFGFPTEEDLALFEMLLTVSGIGPKLASSVLAAVTPSRFAIAVVTGDAKTLTQAQGLGKKGAERIILELKDKLKGVAGGDEAASGGEAAPAGSGADAEVRAEAVSALVVLGYAASDATRVVAKVFQPGMGAEEILRAALRERVK